MWVLVGCVIAVVLIAAASVAYVTMLIKSLFGSGWGN